MDHTTWTQMQQNPPLNPNSTTDPYAQNPYPTQHYYYYSHPQNPNPNPSIDPHNPHEAQSLIQPPGTEPYQPVGPYTLPQSYTYQQTADGSSSIVPSSAYSQDPSLVVAAEPVSTVDYYGVNQYAPGVAMPVNGVEQLVAASSVSSLWTYPTTLPQKAVKKTKVVQSVWCGICNLECNTKDVLELHKLGKKHKKNQEKLKQVSAVSAPTPAPPASNGPIIGPRENPNKIKSSICVRKNPPGVAREDLETKRRKVLKEGAEAAAVRLCGLCNVVCNSETVFTFHLAGKKHATMLRKHASGT